MSDAGKRTSKRRAVELVAICPDQRDTEGLAIAVTVSLRGAGMKRRTFPHDETPESLAWALREASEWVKTGCP